MSPESRAYSVDRERYKGLREKLEISKWNLREKNISRREVRSLKKEGLLNLAWTCLVLSYFKYMFWVNGLSKVVAFWET